MIKLFETLKEIGIKPCQRNLMTFDKWMREHIHNVHYKGLTSEQDEIIFKKFD